MHTTGTIPLPTGEHRTAAAVALAGLLAEHGTQRIMLADPRICATRELVARETDLPRLLIEAHPGTTLSCGEIGLMVDAACIRWAGDGPVVAALRRLAEGEAEEG